MTTQKYVVIYSDRESIDPFAVIALVLLVLELIGWGLVTIFFHDPMREAEKICLHVVPNIMNGVIGSLISAVVYRRKEKQKLPSSTTKIPSVLATNIPSLPPPSPQPQLTDGDDPPQE